eukprot:TRINITY_DN1779_c0_g1_i4.p2 TRINITY_DN1779_c0_g1~~TRINITY_DN1779_c0_g1_i4.p2  ORF type:complete len:720 (-),score=23.77 TRINITY_DN1779_c0_g1_i4:4218-6377(-)
MASIVAHNTARGLTEMPKAVDAVSLVYDGIDDVTPGVDAVTGVTITDDPDECADYKIRTLDRRFEVIGVSKKAVVQTTPVGELFVPAGHNIVYVSAGPRVLQKLNLEPVTAATAGAVRDKHYTAAIAAISALFQSSRNERFPPRAATTIRSLSRIMPDPSRFCYRLATMWWYYRLCEAWNLVAVGGVAVVGAQHVNEISHVTNLLAQASAGTNIISVDLDAFAADASTVLAVLQFAASNTPFAVAGHLLPSIITTALPMPEIQVAYMCSTSMVTLPIALTAGDVWLSAYGWASQMGASDLLTEYVNFIGTQLLSPDPKRDPIFRATTVTVPLPPLDTRHYALLPLAVAADRITGTDCPDEADPYLVLSMAAVRSQLLSCSYRESLWGLGLQGRHRTQRGARQAAVWRRNLLTKARRAYAPVWSKMLALLRKLGLEVSSSRTSLGVSPAPDCLGVDQLTASYGVCSGWIDVFDVVPKVPSAALDSFTHPKASKKLLVPGQWYRVGAMSDESLPSVITALDGVGAELGIMTRAKGDVNWRFGSVTRLAGRYGIVADRPLPNDAADSWKDYVLVGRVPSAAAAVRLRHFNLLKEGWTWYLAGIGSAERLAAVDAALDWDQGVGAPPVLALDETLSGPVPSHPGMAGGALGPGGAGPGGGAGPVVNTGPRTSPAPPGFVETPRQLQPARRCSRAGTWHCCCHSTSAPCRHGGDTAHFGSGIQA